jgi:hypothetical protein
MDGRYGWQKWMARSAVSGAWRATSSAPGLLAAPQLAALASWPIPQAAPPKRRHTLRVTSCEHQHVAARLASSFRHAKV